MPLVSPRSDSDVIADLRRLHKKGYSWRQIACLDPYDTIPPGTLATIHNTGVIPDRWRAVLGLHITAPAPVCPACGIVHVSKRCPRTIAPRRNEPAVRVGEVDEVERSAIFSLTPAQRKQALLRAVGKVKA